MLERVLLRLVGCWVAASGGESGFAELSNSARLLRMPLGGMLSALHCRVQLTAGLAAFAFTRSWAASLPVVLLM